MHYGERIVVGYKEKMIIINFFFVVTSIITFISIYFLATNIKEDNSDIYILLTLSLLGMFIISEIGPYIKN